jgi:hypothetical protein
MAVTASSGALPGRVTVPAAVTTCAKVLPDFGTGCWVMASTGTRLRGASR